MLVALALVSLGRLWWEREALRSYFTSSPFAASGALIQNDEPGAPRLKRDSILLEVRRKRAMTNSDRYYNPDRKGEAAYRQKIRNHQRIASYLMASRRNDPDYHRVMNVLATRGFGILEWTETCRAIITYQGLMSEVDSADAYSQVSLTFTGLFGITDHAFFHNLLSIPLEFNLRESALGGSVPELVIGDEFYTDDDWMGSEFRHARALYTGPRRERVGPYLRTQYRDFVYRCRLRASGEVVPEYRMAIRHLRWAGLISDQDLAGIELNNSFFFSDLKKAPIVNEPRVMPSSIRQEIRSPLMNPMP